MKFRILFFLALFAAALNAQVSVKPSVGFNLASMDGTSNKTFLNGGVTVVKDFEGVVSFETGAHYFGRGAESDEVNVDLRYLEIPLTVRMGDVSFGPLDFYVTGGLSAGVLLSADSLGKEVKSETDNLNFSLVGGVGVKYGKFDVAFKLNSGLKNVYQDRDTKDLAFSLGYSFGL